MLFPGLGTHVGLVWESVCSPVWARILCVYSYRDRSEDANMSLITFYTTSPERRQREPTLLLTRHLREHSLSATVSLLMAT